MSVAKLSWDGKEWDIDKLKGRDAIAFLEKQESLSSEMPLSKQFSIALELLSLLKCPAPILDDLDADRVEELLVLLMGIQMSPRGKKDKTFPVGSTGAGEEGEGIPVLPEKQLQE